MIDAVEMKRKMKDSGVPWIGAIPEDWQAIKLKQLCAVRRGASPRPIDDLKYFDENGEFAWVRISDVTASEKYLIETYERLSDLGASLSVKIFPGQIFLSIAGSVGSPIISKIKCCIHDGFVWFEDLKVDNEFLYYVFKSNNIFLGLGKVGTQLNLNTETVGSIFIPVPQHSQQKQIVAYLDKKTVELDALIKSKQDLIILLEQKRQSTINEAVTGVLQKKVKRKSTGLAGLPEVPENWNINKLKFLVEKIGSGVTPKGGSEIYLDEGIPLIRSQNVHFDGLRLDDVAFISEEIHNTMKSSWVHSHDVLLNITGASIGRCFYVEDEFETANVNQHVCIIRPNNKVYYKFLYYFLASDLGQHQVSLSGDDGISREALNFEQIKNFIIPLPSSLEEMKSISASLDSYTQKVKQLISDINSQIILLQQYRQSLISEVVTGKIEIK